MASGPLPDELELLLDEDEEDELELPSEPFSSLAQPLATNTATSQHNRARREAENTKRSNGFATIDTRSC